MDIVNLLGDKSTKPIEKRAQLAEAITMKLVTIDEVKSINGLDEKKTGIVLEAMEAVTRNNPGLADLAWLKFAQEYIASASNSLKREASRVVGNISHLFPDDLEAAIEKLIENAANDGTVIRWSSAYALGRIILLPRYANSGLFDTVTKLCEGEQENGVKNQYLNGLKKAKRLRK